MKGMFYVLILSLILFISCSSQMKATRHSEQENKALPTIEQTAEESPQSNSDMPKDEYAKEGKGNVSKDKMANARFNKPAPGAPTKSVRESYDGGKGNLEPAANDDKKPIERKIIRDARLTIEVKKFDPAFEKVSDVTRELGGFITNSAITLGTRQEKSGTIVIRLPSESFDRALTIFSNLGIVRQKNIEGKDVTEEYYDTEARLKSFEMLRERYIKLLDKAKTISENLQIEQEINRLQTQIEVLQGRLKYLNNLSALSTITLTLAEPTVLTQQHEKGVFGILFDSVKESLKNFLRAIAGFIESLGVLIPLAILIIIIFYILRFAFRLLKKSYLKQKAKEEILKQMYKDEAVKRAEEDASKKKSGE